MILLSSSSGSGAGGMLILMVVLIAIMWVLMIRPQRKEEKKRQAMLSEMQVGDAVVTSGGFYGIIIDINDADVIVEFGNNRNCRIPMKKEAIAQIEKPQDAVRKDAPKDTKAKDTKTKDSKAKEDSKDAKTKK